MGPEQQLLMFVRPGYVCCGKLMPHLNWSDDSKPGTCAPAGAELESHLGTVGNVS